MFFVFSAVVGFAAGGAALAALRAAADSAVKVFFVLSVNPVLIASDRDGLGAQLFISLSSVDKHGDSINFKLIV
jgi:hypothetical protein